MRNAAVTFKPPVINRFNRSLEMETPFFKPFFFYVGTTVGQVGLAEVPPVRPFFICDILIIAVCFHGLNRGNKHPKVDRVGQGSRNPYPATYCLHVVNFYDICIKTSCFYDLYRRISSPPNIYSLSPDKSCASPQAKRFGPGPASAGPGPG